MKIKPIFNIFQGKKEEKEKKPEMNRKILVDYREKNSFIPSELIAKGIEIEFHNLTAGDYLIGNLIIERKTISDFISSMINKRFLNQIEELKRYENRLLIIEGIDERELYNDKNDGGINPNAIRGFLLSIVLRHKIPIIFSQNYEDTAKYLLLILNKKENEMSLKSKRKSRNKKEQLQFILEGFPGIGPKTARKLLKEFKTIKGVANASEDKLRKCIGKKADAIIRLIREEY